MLAEDGDAPERPVDEPQWPADGDAADLAAGGGAHFRVVLRLFAQPVPRLAPEVRGPVEDVADDRQRVDAQAELLPGGFTHRAAIILPLRECPLLGGFPAGQGFVGAR